MSNYKIGTCCIITKDTNKFSSDKSMMIGTVTQKSLSILPKSKQYEKLTCKVVQNMKALYAQLSYIIKQPKEMHFFRISSNLLPMFDHKVYSELYDDKLLFIVNHWLSKCKIIIDDNNIRVSCHPNQYCVINSDKEHVRNNAIDTLLYHKYFMERLTTPQNGAVINIHLNGKLECLPEIDKLKRLGLIKWLSFENDDKGNADHYYTLEFCKRYNVRYVFDVHHHYVKSGELLDLESATFKDALNTWGDVRPKFHLSQSRDNEQIVRAHSDFITDDRLIDYSRNLLESGDIMIEAKAKNLAVNKFYKDLLI